jgi:TRAP-type C4-dicarboxylate transport system permease small subunit
VSIFSVEFLHAAGERAVKTFAQALVAVFAAGVTVLDIDWVQAVAIAGTAALLSILTSIASNNVGLYYGPSLSDEAVMTDLDDDE